MKQFILILIIILSGAFWLQAQSLHPILVGSAGGTADTTEVYWQFAIGEPLTGTIDESEISNLSIYWLQGVLQPLEDFNPLPLDWLAFWGQSLDNIQNQLNWQVEHDGQNAKFVVQRGPDGIDFEEIAQMDGSGILGSYRTYEYIDTVPVRRGWYYRIQQVDYDGASTFSNIVFLEAGASYEDKLVFVPNPAHDVIRVFGGTSSILSGHLEVYNSLGQSLHTSEFEAIGSKTISLLDWPEGIYHYLWKDANGSRSGGSFVKQ